MSDRPPDPRARRALAAMLALTVVIALGVLALPGLSLNTRSLILIGWMAVMIAVLRRTR